METVVVTKACAIPDPDTGGIRMLAEGDMFPADHPIIEGREIHFGLPRIERSPAAAADDMSVKELRAALEERGQDSKGRKADLVDRYNNPSDPAVAGLGFVGGAVDIDPDLGGGGDE